MVQPSDLEGVAYATADEVDGIRRTLDSFMKTQEQRNLSMENTLDKILGKLDKLSSREGTPIPEDKGSNMKGKPFTPTNLFILAPTSTPILPISMFLLILQELSVFMLLVMMGLSLLMR